MTTPDEIAKGLEHCYSLVEAERGLREEFSASRSEFFPGAVGLRGPGSELRHLEWFVLERPSTVLGAVPAVALLNGEARAELPMGLRDSLLGSIAGAFEVTTPGGGDVHWVRDLFTLGEHPLVHSTALEGVQKGDILVGRLFPSPEGTFVASPALSTYRSAELLAAVRADLAAMRKARRGVLRIQQLELERLFHGQDTAVLRSSQPAEFRGQVRASLRSLGLSEKQVDELLSGVRRAAREGSGRDITELLNQLAFDTGIDLARARQVLVDAWQEERRALQLPEEVRDDARAALAAFDRGRAEGKDLELLFRDLERDLGLEDVPLEEDASEEESGVPDFPGVVGAMVDEFLWDLEREHGQERAHSFACLRVLGDYGRDIGVLEDLGRLRLIDFTARWLLDETRLSRSETAAVLDALREFSRWAEELHDLPLRRDFDSTLEVIRESVLRLVEARPFLSSLGPETELGEIRALEPQRVRLHLEAEEHDTWVPVPEALGRTLRLGDLARVDSGRKQLGGVYPGELRELLPARDV